ncbi:MAG: hypothetical protein ACO3IW_00600 [Burkholderiales bacterium]
MAQKTSQATHAIAFEEFALGLRGEGSATRDQKQNCTTRWDSQAMNDVIGQHVVLISFCAATVSAGRTVPD